MLVLTESPVNTLQLPDGRTLAWYEYGDPKGVPCIYTTGTPASGLTGQMYHASALESGVRIISLDKPGYGHSDYLPNRKLTDWPADIATLADHLRIERFATMGESGGGPHALALAWGIPQRLSITLVVAGMGPGHEDWVREGMKPMNRRLFWMAQHMPWLLHIALGSMKRSLGNTRTRDKWIARQLSVAPPCDRALMEQQPALTPLTLAAFSGAVRQGTKGATQEMQIFGRPWGFTLSEIHIPVQIWHGTEDVNVPVAVARRMSKELPNAETHIFEQEGHMVGYTHAHELMEAIRAANIPAP